MIKRFTRVPTNILNLKEITLHENILIDYQKLIYQNKTFNQKAFFNYLPNSFLLDNLCNIYGTFNHLKSPKSNHLLFLEEGIHHNPSNFIYRYWLHKNQEELHSLTLVENVSINEEVNLLFNLHQSKWYPSLTNFHQFKDSIDLLQFNNKFIKI